MRREITALTHISPPGGLTPQFLLMRNDGPGVLYFGAEENTSNGVDSDAEPDIEDRQGIPLQPGEYKDFSGSEIDLARRFYLAPESGSTCILHYSYGT